MRELIKDKEHLVIMAALFALGITLFLVARVFLVPDDFGVYGHFRAGAIDDNRMHPLSFAGQAACIECHDDISAARAVGMHKGVSCEGCHGPLARHAADPGALEPVRPNGRDICLGCHLENVAKPGTFPQIRPADHGGEDACIDCHSPHHPDFSEEESEEAPS